MSAGIARWADPRNPLATPSTTTRRKIGATLVGSVSA
jgi:hypothetical protein